MEDIREKLVVKQLPNKMPLDSRIWISEREAGGWAVPTPPKCTKCGRVGHVAQKC